MTGSARGAVVKIIRIERNVSSLAHAVAFYRDALGFEVVQEAAAVDPAYAKLLGSETMRKAVLRIGAQELWLTRFVPPGRPYPLNSTSADLWFQHIAVVTPDMDQAYARLCRYDFEPITQNGPQTLPPAAGSVRAYKFRDPDGHPVELIQFPPGTGNPAWQNSNRTAITIGIDHSAVSVSDAKNSIAFYSDVLGMKLVSRQTNKGSEQGQLDDLKDDIVEVVALAMEQSSIPHIELLAYDNPPGQTLPYDRELRDIASDRLVFAVNNLAQIMENKGLSTNAITIASNLSMALIRDPNGHILVLKCRV